MLDNLKHLNYKSGMNTQIENKREVCRETYTRRARRFLKEKCERCPATESLCAHHKDRNWRNNTEENIETLCRVCHMEEHKKAGDLNTPRIMNTTKCKYCDNPSVKRGMCSIHYQRIKRHGTIEKRSTRQKPFEKCQICGEDATIKGMCNKHYLRWRRHGDPLAGGRERSSREGRMCPVCNEPALKWPVYCNKHHLRWKRHGDPLGSAATSKAKKELDAQK